MRWFDFCSGVGAGFLYAGYRIGWRHAAHAEIDNFCADILAKRFPGVANIGDVNNAIKRTEPGEIDLLTCSPPCQPFSIEGKRRGWDDERNCFPSILRFSTANTAIQTSIRTISSYQKLITPAQYGEMLLLIDFPKLKEHELKNAVAKINQAIKMRTQYLD